MMHEGCEVKGIARSGRATATFGDWVEHWVGKAVCDVYSV